MAAKSIIWVAIGLGLYLLPEAARRANTGLDARPILSRSLALIGLCAVPALLIFTLGGEQLLAAAFGDDLTGSADALPWLGAAMALLACTYLSVQYLLALRRRAFVGVLAIAATAEVVVLAGMGADLTKLAFALFLVQLACALVVVTTAYRTPSPVTTEAISTSTLTSVVARVLLGVLAVLVIAWVGVLLRDLEVGKDAVASRDAGRLEDARVLDPSLYWDQVRAGVLLLNGDADAAAAQAEQLVRAEPDNAVAWSVLRAATRRNDPGRAAEATRALRRLNPLSAP